MSMPEMPKVSYAFEPVRAPGSTANHFGAPNAAPVPMAFTKGTVPRLTRLLALAHRLNDLIAKGELASMAEVARAGRLSRARVTQIMDLALLAPDIQEEILGFTPVASGRDPVMLKEAVAIARESYWPDQRLRWRMLRDRRSGKRV